MSDVNTEVVSDDNQENNEQVEEEVVSSQASSGEGNSLKDAAAEVMGSIDDAINGEKSADSSKEEKAEEVADAVEEAVKKWTLKVGGKDVEIDSEEELVRRAQMGYSADEKWQEAAKIKKEMEAFVQALQSDPASALEKMGFDVDDMSEKHIQRRIEQMQKSPEQVERETLQKEIEDLRNERKKEQEDARSSEMTRMQEQYAMQIEKDISDALDSTQTLPKSPYVVKRIADGLLLAMNNGYTDITVKDILPIIENDIKTEIKDMFASMPEELVEAVVGKDVLNRVRKKRVSKAKKATVKPKIQATGEAEIKAAQDKNSKDKEKVSSRDFFRNLGSI